jgi:hypothetical protein
MGFDRHPGGHTREPMSADGELSLPPFRVPARAAHRARLLMLLNLAAIGGRDGSTAETAWEREFVARAAEWSGETLDAVVAELGKNGDEGPADTPIDSEPKSLQTPVCGCCGLHGMCQGVRRGFVPSVEPPPFATEMETRRSPASLLRAAIAAKRSSNPIAERDTSQGLPAFDD